MTPNQVTAISAALSFAGIAVLALVQPSWWMGALVCVALVLGYAFDAADGQLARLRGGGSISGEWLDHMVDAAKITSLHLAVLISVYRFFDLGSAGWLLVPIGFVLVANVMFFGMILNDLLRARQTAATGVPIARPATSTLRSLLVMPTDYGVLCLIFLLMVSPLAFFVAYSVLVRREHRVHAARVGEVVPRHGGARPRGSVGMSTVRRLAPCARGGAAHRSPGHRRLQLVIRRRCIDADQRDRNLGHRSTASSADSSVTSAAGSATGSSDPSVSPTAAAWSAEARAPSAPSSAVPAPATTPVPGAWRRRYQPDRSGRCN